MLVFLFILIVKLEMATYTKKAIARLAREFGGRMDILEDRLNLFDQKLETIIAFANEE